MQVYDANIDTDIKKKGLFVISAKGSNLSAEVKKLIEENAKEYEIYPKEK